MKHFICFAMKPDLTYYHGSLLPLKDFLYFPEKNPGALSNFKPKKQKKTLPKNCFSKKFLTPQDEW